MAAGEIVVSLLAKTGSFDTDIQRSTKAAEKRMKEFRESVKASFSGNLLADFTRDAVHQLAQLPAILIDGIDKLNDVADATGSTIENISALEDVALRTGTSMETVSGALVKFNNTLKEADGKNGASMALKAIGLDAEALKQVDPAEALRQTAVALARFADDGDKARLVQELFGKSVAQVAPLLKDLAEKGQLVATVTTEQAKQAEIFNQELAKLSKNSLDAKRALLGDLLPALNAVLTAMREGGGLAGFLTTGGGTTGDPGAAINDLNAKLEKTKKLRAELDPSKSFANRVNDTLFGDAADLDRQIALWEKQKAYLQSLQRSSALSGLGDVSDAQSRRLGDRPSVGGIPKAPEKGPKGKDPDADFNAYLNNLQQQLQKVDQLTVSEKLLDDIRRGSLTVTDKQRQQLAVLAQSVDKDKEAIEVRKLSRDAAMAEGDAVTKANEEYQALMKRLLDGGPAAQLERQRREMEALAEAFRNGTITADQFNDAATGALNLLAEKVPETKSMAEELGMTFASAFESAALGGGKLSDVFKGLLQDIVRLILRLQVVEPMMQSLKASMSGGGGGGGGGWFGMILNAVVGGYSGGSAGSPGAGFSSDAQLSSYVAGMRADGGPVDGGSTYLVGERGPEMFVPRTSGMIVPNHALGGAQKEHLTIVNQTTGRVDRVVEQRIAPGERALIIQEARDAVAADFSNPNSRVSRSMSSNFRTPRSR